MDLDAFVSETRVEQLRLIRIKNKSASSGVRTREGTYNSRRRTLKQKKNNKTQHLLAGVEGGIRVSAVFDWFEYSPNK